MKLFKQHNLLHCSDCSAVQEMKLWCFFWLCSQLCSKRCLIEENTTAPLIVGRCKREGGRYNWKYNFALVTGHCQTVHTLHEIALLHQEHSVTACWPPWRERTILQWAETHCNALHCSVLRRERGGRRGSFEDNGVKLIGAIHLHTLPSFLPILTEMILIKTWL